MATTATIEKVVRKVVDDELSETRAATLKAIQKVSRLLTEEVIPKLPDDVDQEDVDHEEENPVGRNGHVPPTRRAVAKTRSVEADNPEIPEDDMEEPTTGSVPDAVTEAFEDVYTSLTAEQAKALAAMFTAISREPGSEEA